MEVDRPPSVVGGALAAAMSLVLGDDDLLRDILLRLGIPTSLLRAALVCKRWLRHASDPAFLCGFRARHPPRLLGAYLDTSGGGAAMRPRFLPVRQLLHELGASARRAGSFFDGALRGTPAFVGDSRGGRLLVTTFETHYGDTDLTHLICSPLSPAGDTVVVPPPSPPLPGNVTSPEDSIVYYYHEFLPDDGDGRSYSCVLMGYSNQQTTVRLYELQDMYWVLRSSAAAELSVSPPISKVVLVDGTRFYMLSIINKILVCDFPSSSISAMELPNGVEEGHTGRVMLSRGDGSGGIYLIHVQESHQLRVFRSDNAGNWFLAETVCLRQVCTNLGIAASNSPSVEGQNAGVKIHAVGDNGRFVYWEMFGAVLFLDITSKKAEKVYELTPEDNKEFVSIRPLTLMWLPVFPRSI